MSLWVWAARAVCWGAAVAVGARGISATAETAASVAWLRRCGRDTAIAVRDQVPHVVLVLPLLREQAVLPETLAYFAALARAEDAVQVSIAVVTSERERVERRDAEGRGGELASVLACGGGASLLRRRFAGMLPGDRLHALAQRCRNAPVAECARQVAVEFATLPTTNDLAAQVVAAAREQGAPVVHYDYPDAAGAMAEQVNHAARAEIARLRRQGVAPEHTWVAVYNADSRPHPATLSALARLIATHSVAGVPPRIVQQSALFTGNRQRLSALCAGAGLLQSRWTLAREIPRLRRQASRARRGKSRLPRLAHCVGHGLFVRADTFVALGGLPTATMNEDLAFGFLVCAAEIPIQPLPLLERADAAETLPALIRQQRQWFWSYPQYPHAARLADEAGLGTRLSRAWLTTHGLLRGALWLAQSPAIAATLALPLVDRRWHAGVAAATAIGGYLLLPLAVASRLEEADGRLRTRECVGALGAALASSLGPWWCLGHVLDSEIRGTLYQHAKTER